MSRTTSSVTHLTTLDELKQQIKLLAEIEAGPTPLQVQLDGLGRRLTMIAGAVIALIFVLGLLRGEPLAQIVLTSIALAVAAIPEGLPAVVTVTLALGMHRMAKSRASADSRGIRYKAEQVFLTPYSSRTSHGRC